MKINLLTITRRSFALLCGVGILASFSIQPLVAQDEETPDKKPRPEMKGPDWKKLQPELGLTNEQVAELETLSTDHKAKAQKVRADASLTPDQKREQMKKLREEGKAEVGTVLTAEQRQKMGQLRKRGPEQMKERKEKRQEKQSAPETPQT
jgi:Spy/CpxP family protein refolding chaperone